MQASLKIRILQKKEILMIIDLLKPGKIRVVLKIIKKKAVCLNN
jgi:hypothetical protein